MGKMEWLYGVFNTIGIVAVLVYNLLQYQKKKELLGGVSKSVMAYFAEKQWRGPWTTVAFWVVLETILVSAAQRYFGGFFNAPFGELFNTGANYFGMLFGAPLLIALVCILLRIDLRAQFDLITPAYPLALIFVKVACYFAGCCRGIAWDGGIYNPITNLTEFPAQLLECAMSLALFVFLLFCKGKLKKGTVFPVYLMAYSGTRFFTEYLRCEPRVFWGLKTYQLLCLAGVLVGAVEYLLVCGYNRREEAKKQKT